ncbi:MAG: DUF4038 domain-containing protein [Saprospiraceae bacterium]|nr:DUF4038 domain-containing protein [Saprospiraceae bacterium]
MNLVREFILFLSCVFLILSCREKSSLLEPVRFAKPWEGIYSVSPEYTYQLVNDAGEYLYLLNKTAWAFFAAENPQAVLDHVRKHGANVIRVCLEGSPYPDYLHYDLWPWGGTRDDPDYSTFNVPYWKEVEARIAMAGEAGIGLDIVLYFTLVPGMKDLQMQKKYCDEIFHRLAKYSNILTWEIMNEEISNEEFQDSIAAYVKQNDPFGHLIISSDGTTEDALWPHKDWMSLALVHTCTGNQPAYDLEHWYLNIARNTRQYGKPAFNNESGREKRHKNDDPVFRRKQGWIFANSGCFWTWHSWDGCEGINDSTYFADGWQYVRPMKDYYESLPFWKLEPNYTICRFSNDKDLVYNILATPNREVSVIYTALRQTGALADANQAYIRLRNGAYGIRFINPSDMSVIDTMQLASRGLRSETEITIPSFRDDLIIEILLKTSEVKTLIEGTQ